MEAREAWFEGQSDLDPERPVFLFLLRTGAPGDTCRKTAFPSRSTMYNTFRKFQADGT